MNEKIKEFAFECARELDWDPPTEPKTYTFTEAGIEKFAELIVRECAGVADDWYRNHDKIHSDPMSYVLAHFGVEE